MRTQVYGRVAATMTITAATARQENGPSHTLQEAKIHEELSAKLRAHFREWRHVGIASAANPCALCRFIPTFDGSPIYKLDLLRGAGSTRAVDPRWNLEITALRWDLVVQRLPGSFLGDPVVAEAVERNLSFAAKRSLVAAGFDQVMIPDDLQIRFGDRTEIDCLIELGPEEDPVTLDLPAGS